jgi:hypothetical protein
MWKLFRYTIDGESVVGIGTFADHSALFFYRGRELDDGSDPMLKHSTSPVERTERSDRE